MFCARLQSTTVLMMAPLCEINAMLPGFGDWWTYVVSIPRGGTIMPRQFGPMSRDIVAFCNLDDPVLEGFTFRSHLLETCSNDDNHRHMLCPALLDNSGHMDCRDGDDCHVDRRRNRRNVGICLEPLDLGALVIDRVELAREVEQVVHNRVPHLA
jgi:hypothetical protein